MTLEFWRWLQLNASDVEVSSSFHRTASNVPYFGANNCHALCHNISNLNPNQSMYNYHEKYIYLRTFSFVLSIRKKTLYRKKSRRYSFVKSDLEEFIEYLSLQALFMPTIIVRGLSFLCRFHSSSCFNSKRILMRMSGRFGHCESVMLTLK